MRGAGNAGGGWSDEELEKAGGSWGCEAGRAWGAGDI